MFVVIFRIVTKDIDDEYNKTANELMNIAFSEFNCIEVKSITEGKEEITLSYWHSLEDIKNWKAHPIHVKAQKMGKERWFESFSIQIAEIGREYKFG
jgi:heme-degrading monooxygenase HmoA